MPRLINNTCRKIITYFTIKIFFNNITRFLTMDIHHHFTMDIYHHTIPWVNMMAHQYHMPKTIIHFTIKIIFTINKTFNHGYSPHFTMDIINHTIPWPSIPHAQNSSLIWLGQETLSIPVWNSCCNVQLYYVIQTFWPSQIILK